MSIYKGTELLAGVATDTISNANYLLDFKWSDHIINSMEWLRADTFSWQSGDVYKAAYNHILADYNGGTSQTETIGSYTITYVLADDGHKITTDETTVQNIYNATGVAWYYVLDTTNTRFKLPRTKFGFTGLRDTVGKYVPESLPNITSGTDWVDTTGGTSSSPSNTRPSNDGCFVGNSTGGHGINGNTYSIHWSRFDASNSSSVYQNNAPVQQRATQMYLYFYVGQFSQSATEQTAGLNSELFNGKADTDLNNVSAGIDFVVESYQNGTEWYRLYKSGWVEQGGIVNYTTDSLYTVQLPKEMSDVNYCIQVTIAITTGNVYDGNLNARRFSAGTVTTTSFKVRGDSSLEDNRQAWYVCGMSAQS